MNFYVGQQVECVDAGGRDGNEALVELVEGAVYHVAQIIDGGKIGLGLQLHELFVEPPLSGYYANRFRPFEPKTDITALRKILVDA